MRKSILILLLAGMSSAVMASNWLIASDDNGNGQTSYADIDSIRKTDDIVKMWVMTDFKKAQIKNDNKPYRSFKAMFEFNCKANEIRASTVLQYAGQKGEGDVVLSGTTNNIPWRPIVPDTINEVYSQVACGTLPRPK